MAKQDQFFGRQATLLDPGLSVRLSVNNFYSALDLPYYWEESNETLHSERISNCSCAPGYRFYRAAKNVPVGLDRKSRFSLIMRLSYSALDLRHYLEESNKTWHSERIYIVVVHLGIGFIKQRKNVPVELGLKSRFLKSWNCTPAGDLVSLTDILVLSWLPIKKIRCHGDHGDHLRPSLFI